MVGENPWTTADGLQKFTKKQLISKLRECNPGTAAAPTQSPVGGRPVLRPALKPKTVTFTAFSQQDQRPSPAAGDWSHRKAEWICPCGIHNFVTRFDCRRCRKTFDSTMTLVPAGSPPSDRKRGPPVKQNAPTPAAAPAPDSVQAAEQALAAVRQANAPQPIIDQWEGEVKRRKEVADSSKVPPSLRSRLAQATADANSAMQSKEEAELGLKHAKAALEAAQGNVTKAETALQEAAKHEQKAATQLKMVTSEVSPPQPSADSATQATAHNAATKEAMGDLNTILSAYRAAVSPGSNLEQSRQQIDELLTQAITRADSRQAIATRVVEEVEEEKTHMEMGPCNKQQKRELGAAEPTQLGEEDPTEDEVAAWLEKMSPQKRQCAMNRLTQMGVVEEAQAGLSAAAGTPAA